MKKITAQSLFANSFKPKFKGTIWDNCKNFRLEGKAYASMPPEQDGHFDIRTARQLQGPLAALNDPLVRMVFIIGAVQVLKSVAGDITVVYWIEHTTLNVLIIFEDDNKAKDYSVARLMPTIKAHPVIRQLNAQMAEMTDRHQVTNLMLRLPGGRTIKIGGANDGNLSSMSWPLLWSSEAWQWKPGMLKKFIRRADRYPDSHKILIESQAGMDDCDLHKEVKLAHPVPLTWACPFCGGRQTWECTHEYGILRPADFIAIRPTNLPPGQLELWRPPLPGSKAGMNIPEADSGNGKTLTLEERARLAKWECYHCGTLIEDTKANRMRICDSYQQDYRIPIPGSQPPRFITPKAVAFYLPKEAAWNNRFESGAANYLSAKESQTGGNETPLINWYLQERAVFYTPRLTQTRVETVVSSVDLDEKGRIPNEAFRSLVVDCQKDLVESLKQGKDLTGHFWYVVCANDKAGNTVELQWGYATSWEQLFGRVELDKDGKRIIKGGIKNKFNVPTRNVCVDASNWLDIVKEKAAHYRTIEPSKESSTGWALATWKLMWGDDGSGHKWPDGIWRSYWPPKTYIQEVLEPDGKWIKIKVQAWRWSNLAAKQILFKMRLGLPGQPKITHTPAADETTRAKAVGQKAYDEQMNGFAVRNNERTGKPEVTEFHKEQHLVDCHCENIVLKMMHGTVRGETAAGTGEAQEAKGD